MKFFFDNCISIKLTRAMQVLCADQHDLEHLTDRFPADCRDVDWIPVIATDSQIVLVSADPTITSAKKEREVWRQAGLTSFFFGGGFGDAGFWRQAHEVVRWWPEVIREARGARRGTGYLLPMKGTTVKLLYDPI